MLDIITAFVGIFSVLIGYAEYFKSTKSIAFNQQANIDEIDKLMAAYKEWKKVGKK